MRKLINNTQKSPNKKSDFNALRQNSKIFFLGKISVILLETSGFFAKILNNNQLKTLYNNNKKKERDFFSFFCGKKIFLALFFTQKV